MAHTPLVDSGMAVNMNTDQSVDRTGGTLEYCRLKEITVQAWSPFQRGFFEGTFLGDSLNYPELNEKLSALAEKYSVTPAAIAVAWLTCHPAACRWCWAAPGTTGLQRNAPVPKSPLPGRNGTACTPPPGTRSHGKNSPGMAVQRACRGNFFPVWAAGVQPAFIVCEMMSCMTALLRAPVT